MPTLNEEEAVRASEELASLRKVLQNVLFGQDELIDQVVVALLCGGHVLLEGLPGLGKTQLIKALGRAVRLDVRRVQFTPDLLPGDVTGSPLLEEHDGRRTFVFHRGPVFANLLLADEINRASPKTQSALLEAMQEGRVTIMGESHELPKPFFVLATQNPIELEGTYPLPEAQLDRFLFKLNVTRGSIEVLERIIKNREIGEDPQVEEVLDREALLGLMQAARSVYLPEVVTRYIARLVHATHDKSLPAARAIKFGASPRAALALAAAVRAQALLEGRINASFEDVARLAVPVLQHRLILEYTARLEGRTPEATVQALLAELPFQERPIAATLAESPL